MLAAFVLSALIAGAAAGCTDYTDATCKDSNSPGSCHGVFYSGICSGASNIKCCFLASKDQSCVTIGGKCQVDSMTCSGGYESSKCQGPSARKCCKQGPTGDGECLEEGGSCQSTSTECHDKVDANRYESGKCDGASTRKCCKDPCSGVRVISRVGWGATAPSSTTTLTTPVSKVFIHHTTGNRCWNTPDCISKVKGIQNYHMNTKKWDDIGYSFLVGDDGFIYEGRGWKTQGAHTSGYNAVSIALSFIGDFTSELPSQRALDAAEAFITCSTSSSLNYVSSSYKLHGHKDSPSANTECPGSSLYTKIKTWTNYDGTV